MDYLQYYYKRKIQCNVSKPVLNLIINGLPSIHNRLRNYRKIHWVRFKPYYKWITFNTCMEEMEFNDMVILNLIINGLPSIPPIVELETKFFRVVLNLIINGLPSILGK